MNRKQIIAITVLGILMLMLGCQSNSSGRRVIQEISRPEDYPKNQWASLFKKNNQLKPPRKLTLEEKKIVGVFFRRSKSQAYTYRWVFLANGTVEWYTFDRREHWGDKWLVVNNELHIGRTPSVYESSIGRKYYVQVYKINPDNSITSIASISDGKRTDLPKEKQTVTYKKIK